MPYIYKITNNLNGKSYIGKTLYSIEKRWKEHCHDVQSRSKEKRPLYAAMRKYGVENFSISIIEECDYTVLNEREIYWIAQFNTYNYGYNATLGGDGKTLIDYNLVYETYKQCGENCTKTAQKLNLDAGHVSNIIKLMGGVVHHASYTEGKIVNMYNLQNQFLQTFPSTREAARYIINTQNKDPTTIGGCSSHISEVCRGKRKTAYGYIWRFGSA